MQLTNINGGGVNFVYLHPEAARTGGLPGVMLHLDDSKCPLSRCVTLKNIEIDIEYEIK